MFSPVILMTGFVYQCTTKSAPEKEKRPNQVGGIIFPHRDFEMYRLALMSILILLLKLN